MARKLWDEYIIAGNFDETTFRRANSVKRSDYDMIKNLFLVLYEDENTLIFSNHHYPSVEQPIVWVWVPAGTGAFR